MDGIPFFAADLGINYNMTMPGSELCITMINWPDSVRVKLANSQALYDSYKEVTGYALPISFFAENGRAIRQPGWLRLKGAMDEDTGLMYNSIQDLVMNGQWKMILAADEAEFDAIWNDMADKARAMGYEEVQTAAKQLIDDAVALDARISGK